MTDTYPLRADAGGVVLEVWVVSGASRTEIKGMHGGALRVRVAAPPAGGQANETLVRFLSKATGCRVALESGAGSRRKKLRIDNGDVAVIAAKLGIG